MNPQHWQFPLVVTIAVLFCIVMLRAGGTYALGRSIAAGTARTRWRRILESNMYQVSSDWLDRWGPLTVSLSFLTVGFQTAVQLGAGVMRMPLRRYVPALVVGSVIWAVMYGTVGFIGLIAIKQLWALSPLLTVVLALLLAGVVVFVIRNRRSTATPATGQETDSSATPPASESPVIE